MSDVGGLVFLLGTALAARIRRPRLPPPIRVRNRAGIPWPRAAFTAIFAQIESASPSSCPRLSRTGPAMTWRGDAKRPESAVISDASIPVRRTRTSAGPPSARKSAASRPNRRTDISKAAAAATFLCIKYEERLCCEFRSRFPRRFCGIQEDAARRHASGRRRASAIHRPP